ncbi:hypothetical protein TNCV_877421 [Trichonephila clavipes]|nr:hypothetical protein TNCV_877421 [Trichonephila clavipes]
MAQKIEFTTLSYLYGIFFDFKFTTHCEAVRGLLATVLLILNNGQVTRTLELVALLTFSPRQRDDLLLPMPPDRQRPDQGPTKFIMAKGYVTPVVIRSFEHHTCDRMIWLGFTPILRENTLGVARGL